MKTITRSEFIKWIMAQPPERVYDYSQSNVPCDIGCPMIHYAREHNIQCSSVGMERFYFDNEQTAKFDWFPGVLEFNPGHFSTYGQLQQDLRFREIA